GERRRFLELVESTALLSTGAALLLLCVARPDLLDRRPGWPGTLRLEPLQAEEAAELVGDAVPVEARERIVQAAGRSLDRRPGTSARLPSSLARSSLPASRRPRRL